MNKIITIGREFGSGGRELGKRLADILDIAYYDKEIVAEIAARTEIAEEYVERVLEKRPRTSFPITIGRSFCPVVDPCMDINNKIYAEQDGILKDMADRSDCVIVGRCADHLLRDRKPYKIFVYADMASKIARCRIKADDAKGLTDKEIKAQIKRIDKERASYYEFITGQKWGDKLNYDICVNTTDADIREVAEVLAKMI